MFRRRLDLGGALGRDGTPAAFDEIPQNRALFEEYTRKRSWTAANTFRRFRRREILPYNYCYTAVVLPQGSDMHVSGIPLR